GNYFPVSTSTNTTTVTIKCGSLGVDILPSFTVSLSAGNAGSPASRYLNKAGSHLSYNIYTSLGYSTAWGSGSGGSAPQSYSSSLSLDSINFTGYGRIPSGQYLSAGSYTDSITVTVAY